jgi:signal transduction histidine kinase
MAFGKFAKYTPDEITYRPERLEVVRELRSHFDRVVGEDAAAHEMVFDADPKMLVMLADPKQIELIVMNLLQNAVKYSAQGTQVILSFRLVLGQPRIQVSDQGIGIPESAREALFSPFYRAENVADLPGTGLGLAILKRAVLTSGARVELESELAQGTTFTVTLPRLPG